jgi:hypothetical protein
LPFLRKRWSYYVYWGRTSPSVLNSMLNSADGLDRGTFEGSVSVVAGQPVVQGKWKYTGGEGSFAGITGRGTFKTKLTSATTLEATWEGAYELAGARAKAV